ncbi:MAG TPA: murein biosynthesis integral membrane protein MurJ [Alphaproteobacteria bacterium]|jgi:putative peptidoglycan lipid II flippase|nr:murein biosynthesis integral membrane protein MurJ [Alphaproteobacteria bacterium]
MAFARAITTIGGLTLVSRVCGFARDMLMAAVLGAGGVGDAFLVAFKFPNLFRRLFAEGAFNAAFVPLFAGKLHDGGREAARAFAEEAQAMLSVALVAFVAITMLAMPWAMYVFAPGFASDPAKFDLAVDLTRITMPFLAFISIVSLQGAVMNAIEKFAVAASTPTILNIFMIAALLLWPYFADAPVHVLAWSVTLAGVAEALWLMLALERAGMGLRWRRPRLSPAIRRLLVLMAPVTFGAGVYQVNVLLDVVFASFLPTGAISFLYYADRVAQLPLGVIGVAVGTALLPRISRQIRAGQEAQSIADQNRAIEGAILLTLPAAIALAVAAIPITAVLFGRGRFGGDEIGATAAALAAFAAGLPAQVLVKVLSPGFYAREDTKTPVKIALGAMILNAAVALSLMPFIAHVGIAIATSVAGWFNAMMLGRVLMKRGHFAADSRLRARLVRIVGASIAMGLVVAVADQMLAAAWTGSLLMRVGALAIVIAAGLASFGVAALAFGATRPAEVKSLMKR